jgi:hypothetical protein
MMQAESSARSHSLHAVWPIQGSEEAITYAMNPRIDKLIMLLSTDWFLDLWPMIGLRTILERGKLCLQKGCRDIARDILSTEEQ